MIQILHYLVLIMNLGKTLFAQIMEFIPWKTFSRIIDRYNGDAGIRTLDCADVFRLMAFSQLTWRESLRDIEACLTTHQKKLFHMGIKNIPARSTLADALNNRDWRIYHELAMRLIDRARKLYSKEKNNIDLDATIYALDSTTIDLCLSLFDWAPFRTTKSAVKMHTLLDLRGNIPAFIHISDGKMADVKILDVLPIEASAFYVMDRGYVDFSRLYSIHQAGAFFVTRAKKNMDIRRIYSNATDRSTGIISDQVIAVNGVYSSKDYPEYLRKVRFKDTGTNKILVFITNNTALPPLMIAALYKNRWHVELFFKWIKQHLRIKRFLGTSENAVKTQIWSAVASYVLIAIIKKELGIKISLYSILQILSVSVFEKIGLFDAFQPDINRIISEESCNQLSLFDF
jgi:hypothetical protein